MQLRRLVAPVTMACALTAAIVAVPHVSSADPLVVRDASTVVRWNEIAERTITENAVPVPASSLYYAFVALASYDAVVAIEGGSEPFSVQPRPHAHASPAAAGATAAYRVLRNYFPNSAEALDADYATSMAAIPNGVGKVHGVRVGEAAAQGLIASRSGDGRGATVPQPGDGSAGAGEWRPTPPANAPMAVPWLGFVDPLVLSSPTAIALDGPDPLDSDAYTDDFVEVRDYGGTTSLRSASQTATAHFWNANPVRQYNVAMRGQVVARNLDIVDSARAFAVLHASSADALIACWRAKYDTNFWRPVTAIALADTDGNDATSTVPGWTPLATTPPYSDYPSGHACLTGATTGALAHLFGSSLTPSFTVPSFATGVSARQYGTTAAIDNETIDARIWLGFHFRTAMVDGNALGHAVAARVAADHFQPTD
jgi:hypothetical protein